MLYSLHLVIILIPPGKVSKSFADPDGGAEAVVFFETGAVGIGDRDVAGLHADQFAVSVKVVVPGEDAGADKLFFLRTMYKKFSFYSDLFC